MKLLKWLLLFLLAFSSSFAVDAQVYTFKNYNYEEGVNLVSILSVEESDDGYIWFGTDGAGLLRFDGEEFDYLTEIQGRNNRHVNSISFHHNQLFYTSLFRGVYTIREGQIERFKFLKLLGRSHGVFHLENSFIVFEDSGLRLFKDTVLVQEETIFPINTKMEFYGEYKTQDELFIFSSERNYHVQKKKIASLNAWLGVDEVEVKDYVAAFKKQDSLIFVDKWLKSKLTVALNDVKNSRKAKKAIKGDLLGPDEYVIKWDNNAFSIFYLTNKGRVIVYDIHEEEFKIIKNNSKVQINDATDILVDRNNDIWVTTKMNGAFRISLEPFTQLNNHDLLRDAHIYFVGKTNEDHLILSIGGQGTFIGEETDKDSFVQRKEVYVISMTHVDEKLLVSTNLGVFQVKGKELVDYEPLRHLKGERVSLIFNDLDYIWYAIESNGLFRKNLKTNEVESFPSVPAYIYNAVAAKDSSAIYFGTNLGILKYDRFKNQFEKRIKSVDGESMGFYVGNSSIDIYGTVWFTIDKGLIGITKDNKRVAISSEKVLPSLLFYTLNTDNFGNIIVGTNKGITRISVNKNGEVLNSKTYNKQNGFYGYETHMRSAFKSEDGNILLGTLGGLILLRPELFVKETMLNQPVIFSFKNKNTENLINSKNPIVFNSENNNLLIEFKSINSKSNHVSYSYKLVGPDKKWKDWSEWSTSKEAILNNVQSGSYEFLVKSSDDGIKESKPETISFAVKVPFYSSKWFIILIIGLALLLNVLFLNKVSSFNRKNIILDKNINADRKMAKGVLIFGAIANTSGHLFGPRLDETLTNYDFIAIVTGMILILMYFIMKYIDRSNKQPRIYLLIGYFTLLIYNYVFAYFSDIHPFYFVGILLVTFVAPYILRSLREAIYLSFFMGFMSISIIYLVENSGYNQYLFLMGTAIASFLMIFKTYLRNSSLEQLIFTSGVVNNGNALVVAFDKKGTISFASSNIGILLGLDDPLKGESIMGLKNYQPLNSSATDFSYQDMVTNFKEGAIFVAPFYTADEDVVYYQWSCEMFSDDLRVILGQDVTEKINLENYYELIVKNADGLIFQMDTTGNFTFVNEKSCDVFERPKEELLEASLLDFVEPSYRKEVKKYLASSLRESSKGKYKEFPIRTHEGEVKWLAQNLTTMRKTGVGDGITGFLGLARDITSTRKANAIIKEQNKSITDSINYARRIQFNMLPRSAEFKHAFKDHFILYRPKDIVSGDFFWLKEVEDKTILILSDCTGHGVPGSFMTLLGINILNQIIEEARIVDPGEILNQLDERLSELLPRDGQNRIQDGMEIVVCAFDKNTDRVEYALAGGRFLIKDNKTESVQVIKGQIKHIGGEAVSDDFRYKTEEIVVTRDQIVYLFSDGYPDQFGGSRNKKITIKKFLALVDAISNQPMSEQNTILQEYHREWVGNTEQTDDITVIAVRGKK
ncbi:SpoIIE family protein phosphatase [Brumimicrobium oceani]|uniref:PAC domain-containing protein n=1 Tax=Brumimicrobium oceani TaxID=2100725 RepID=A0A2U2XDN3_9FLAO|nr:SpoIIE family protein phosphatase [Brumimicrobium oceani]PWH85904.1 hypothetical protein DIT68_07380 [Brumimicrobium oceani]